MKFLLESERYWMGASSLEAALTLLGVPVELYTLATPAIYSAEEINCWLDSLENDLRLADRSSEAYVYVKQICSKLREWAEKDYIIHVKS